MHRSALHDNKRAYDDDVDDADDVYVPVRTHHSVATECRTNKGGDC